jgi:hypothetical protein
MRENIKHNRLEMIREEMKPIRGFWDYLNEHGEWG